VLALADVQQPCAGAQFLFAF
jgi:hypothetical protein